MSTVFDHPALCATARKGRGRGSGRLLKTPGVCHSEGPKATRNLISLLFANRGPSRSSPRVEIQGFFAAAQNDRQRAWNDGVRNRFSPAWSSKRTVGRLAKFCD